MHPSVKVNGKTVTADIRDGFLWLNKRWKKGDRIDLGFNLSNRTAETNNVNSIKGYHSYWHGPLILGHSGTEEISLSGDIRFRDDGANKFIVEGTDIALRPVNHLMDSTVTRENGYSVQVLFRD